MSLSQFELINAALVKLGAFKITSLADASTESEIAGTLYGPVRDAVLSAYPWGFAVKQVALTAPTGTPVADYSYAFTVPTDTLRVLSIGISQMGAGLPYRFVNNQIEVNTDQIILTYVARVAESAQPAYFDLVLINRLAAELCIPITENTARAEGLYRLSDLELARAKNIDAQQDTPVAMADYSLIKVRG